MCYAQGHTGVTPVRLKPTAPRSRVKHSTTKPLRSLSLQLAVTVSHISVVHGVLKGCIILKIRYMLRSSCGVVDKPLAL